MKKSLFILLTLLSALNICFGKYAYPPTLGDSFAGYNEFMNTNSCPGCFIPGLTLLGEVRPHANLHGAKAFNSSLLLSVLNNSDLSHANLENSWMYAAHINVTDFSCSNLTGALAGEAFFVNDKFDCAVLDNAKFNQSNMSKSSFKGTSCKNTDFSHAILTLAEFECVDFWYAILLAANLNGSSVIDCDFSNASLKKIHGMGTNLTGSNFRYAKMYLAKFKRSKFIRSKFYKALMYKMEAHHCDFTGADLSHAECIDVDFRYSNMTDAKLDHANFTGAILMGVQNLKPSETTIFCQTIMPDGKINNSGCHMNDKYIKDLIEIENIESETTTGKSLDIRPDIPTTQADQQKHAQSPPPKSVSLPDFTPNVTKSNKKKS